MMVRPHEIINRYTVVKTLFSQAGLITFIGVTKGLFELESALNDNKQDIQNISSTLYVQLDILHNTCTGMSPGTA